MSSETFVFRLMSAIESRPGFYVIRVQRAAVISDQKIRN